MTIAETMMAELESEAGTTRRFLERVPAGKLGWKPHEKSLTAGQLAMHIATIPGGIADMGAQDECPPPDFGRGFPQPASIDDLLQSHDESVAHAMSVLSGMDDARMTGPWKLVAAGEAYITMPRVAFYRNVMFNHLYHHRGQLGVYLRLLDVPVPWAYGPSGDEVPPQFERLAELTAARS